MHYHVETNALICLIKRLAEAYSGDLVYISCYQKLCDYATGIDISLTTFCILQTSIQHNCKHHIFSQ